MILTPRLRTGSSAVALARLSSVRAARALSSTAPRLSCAPTETAFPPRIAPLPSRSVLEVSGPDAQKFLKGQMCKDVDSLAGGYSGFLNASGRILHTVFSVPSKPNTYLISHESGPDHPAPLEKLLPPFRLRSKVRFKDVSAEWDVWGAWGHDEAAYGAGAKTPSSIWRYGSGGASERVWSWDDGVAPLGIAESEVGCWDLRAGWGPHGMGRKLYIPKGAKPSLTATHDLATPDDYTLHRMCLGVPEGSREIVPGSSLPLESDMDIHGGVDFRKGCYLGQELTVRTYHTGATRKRILPLRLFPLNTSTPLSSIPLAPLEAGPALPLPSEPIDIRFTPPSSAASKKGRSAGKLLSLHPTASSVGLGLVRLEFSERVWADSSGTVDSWGANGTLTATIDGVEWGVYVGHGEAYAEALRHIPPPPPPEEE